MADLYCKNITSLKRHLPQNATLLLGDQITEGSAIKTPGEKTTGISDEELLKNQIAGEIYGISGNMVDLFPVGSIIGPGDYVSETGFVAGPDGATVIHSGYGGEARAFAAGTGLRDGDILINGWMRDENGARVNAPAAATNGSTVGDDGAVVSPGGADPDADEYCSLQELAGKPVEGSFLDDLASELDIDMDIPGLDFAWWVIIQKKINELTALQGKFLAKTKNLVSLVELDPEDACAYVPDISKLLELMQKVQRTISKIKKVLRALNKLIKKLKKVIKLIKFLFAPIRMVEAFLFCLQIIEGMAIMLDQAYKNLADTSKLLPQLISLLKKLLAQCATNRGAEAGLSAEECAKLGGVYVDRRPGDMGDTSGGQLEDQLDELANSLGDEYDEDDYMAPGLSLNPGDQVNSGSVVDDDGNEYNIGDGDDPTSYEAPFIIPDDGANYSAGQDGASGESDNAALNEQELEALLDSQILDLNECMTELESMDKANNFI